MDTSKFEELSTRVAAAKEQKARAVAACKRAEGELVSAREDERKVYQEWSAFVREQAGFGDLTYE